MSTATDRQGVVLRYYAPAVLFAILIFAVSSFPGQRLPNLHFNPGDKIAHFFEFGIFGILLYRAFRDAAKLKHPFIATMITGILYAAFDEIHQAFVPGRFSDITDFAADAAGLLLVGGAFLLVTRAGNSSGG